MNYIDLLKPSVLKILCEQAGFAPSKQYGQNYLISDRPIKAMIEAAKLEPTDIVVEIGPGFGVLTLAIAPRVQKVLSFEIERNLQTYWEERQEEYPNVEIVWGNALREIKNYPPSPKGYGVARQYKILANLPYQITAKAIRTMLELSPLPEVIVVMVQKEVADRICAPLGGIKMKGKAETEVSLLTVAVQYYGTPKLVTNVPRGSFWPSPKVDSAVIMIENLQERPQSEKFFRLARAGFAHKRKFLRHNIIAGLQLSEPLVTAALKRIVGNEKVRAEELSIAQWEGLANDLL